MPSGAADPTGDRPAATSAGNRGPDGRHWKASRRGVAFLGAANARYFESCTVALLRKSAPGSRPSRRTVS
jgi:hypothetical protein